mgnify:CR=1 FL=1
MAAIANVTITTDIGPAIQNTTQVYAGVKRIDVDLTAETLSITKSDGVIAIFDFDSIATVAWTIASGVHTVSFT